MSGVQASYPRALTPGIRGAMRSVAPTKPHSPCSDSDASKRCASRRRKCQGPCSPGGAGRGRCPPWKWKPGCRCRLASRRTPEGGAPPPTAAASMSHNPGLCWFGYLLLRSNCPTEGRVSHQPVHESPGPHCAPPAREPQGKAGLTVPPGSQLPRPQGQVGSSQGRG